MFFFRSTNIKLAHNNTEIINKKWVQKWSIAWHVLIKIVSSVYNQFAAHLVILIEWLHCFHHDCCVCNMKYIECSQYSTAQIKTMFWILYFSELLKSECQDVA